MTEWYGAVNGDFNNIHRKHRLKIGPLRQISAAVVGLHKLSNLNICNKMKIYALKGPSSSDYGKEVLAERQQFLTDSIKSGISRFGWSGIDTADLTTLKNKSWQEMSKDEQTCWAKTNFLLGVKRDDWVVHINLPGWGACLAAKVSDTYSFETTGNKFNEFRHLLKLDASTLVKFDRNDDAVLPIISSRLKLQGRYWTIQYVDEFLQTIENIKAETLGKREDESVGVFYLKKDLSPLLTEITKKIQKSHPRGALEALIAEVLRRMPNVIGVIEHGKHKGWGTDNGADLIVTYRSGLSVSNLEKEEILVVQVKSYTQQHWETKAVQQIEDGITEFEASMGLIVSTAERTKPLEQAIETLSNKLKKPIGLIAGDEVATFVLKYGGEIIL